MSAVKVLPAAASTGGQQMPDNRQTPGRPEISPMRRILRRAGSSTPIYMTGVLIALVILFTALAPTTFPTLANGINILAGSATLLVMATAVTYVMVAGGIDLSIGSVLVFANVLAAKTMEALGTNNVMTVVVGFAVALGAGLFWGIFNGLCITRLHVPALITTLGTLGAVLGLADVITNGNDLRDVPSTVVALETGSLFGLSWLIWIAILVVVVGGLALGLTRFGRNTYTVGSNEEAARRGGVNVDRHLLKLYALSGLLAGLAGMMDLVRFTTTSIGGHTTDFLVVITGVVLGGISLYGGIGSVIGAVVGIAISQVLDNGFIVLNVQPFWQQVAIGFVLIAAVYFDQLKRRRRDLA